MTTAIATEIGDRRLRDEHAGFTLLELMIALVVAGVLFGYAIPSMQVFAQNSRLTTATNELVADLNLARSEAIKRAGRAVVCKSNTATAATPTCTAAASWADGRLVFIDAPVGTPPVYNGMYLPGDNDLLIRRRAPLEGGGNSVSALQEPANVAVNAIAFNRLGMAQIPADQTTSFRVCDGRGATRGKAVRISPTGRPAVEAANAC